VVLEPHAGIRHCSSSVQVTGHCAGVFSVLVPPSLLLMVSPCAWVWQVLPTHFCPTEHWSSVSHLTCGVVPSQAVKSMDRLNKHRAVHANTLKTRFLFISSNSPSLLDAKRFAEVDDLHISIETMMRYTKLARWFVTLQGRYVEWIDGLTVFLKSQK